MESSPDKKVTTKRVSRKRATTKRVDGEVSRKSPRKRATRNTVATKTSPPALRKSASQTEAKVETKIERKAPTAFAAQRVSKRNHKKQVFLVGVLILLGVGVSAMVGFMDEGVIDVQKTIEDRNERIRTNTADERDIFFSNVEVPVQNTSKKADGGLIGRPTPVTPKPASTTATSTEETASTTDAIASSTESVASSTEATSDTEDTNSVEADDSVPSESL